MTIHGWATWAVAIVGAALAAPASLHAQPARNESRGQLLYTVHCIACHTTQIHWRSERKATDLPGLQTLVRRWQGNAGLQWPDDDVAEVTQFLNETIYRFP